MARRVNGTTAEAAVVQKSTSSVLYDEILESKSGKSIRIVVDIAEVLSDAEQYHEQLLFSRSIPFDRENIPPVDMLVIWCAAEMPWLKGNDIIKAAKSHYDKLAIEAYREAIMLAILKSPENVFENEPKPYPASLPSLPGTLAMPTAQKNLANPVERRLKQILDFLSSDVEMILRFNSAFNAALAEIGRREGSSETDENGFRS